MATSEVNRRLVPAKPNFYQGDLVISNSGILVLCNGEKGITYFRGAILHSGDTSYPIGAIIDTLDKSVFKPFKGSVTLTEA